MRCCHVDVNPDYADSLEMDTFCVHLMFEMPEAGSIVYPDDLLTLPHFRGDLAFENGLDEVMGALTDT